MVSKYLNPSNGHSAYAEYFIGCLFIFCFFLYILHKPLFVFINGFNVNLGLCTDILVLWCLVFFLNLSMMVTSNHVLWLWLLFGSFKWLYGNNRVRLAGLEILKINDRKMYAEEKEIIILIRYKRDQWCELYWKKTGIVVLAEFYFYDFIGVKSYNKLVVDLYESYRHWGALMGIQQNFDITNYLHSMTLINFTIWLWTVPPLNSFFQPSVS